MRALVEMSVRLAMTNELDQELTGYTRPGEPIQTTVEQLGTRQLY
jgi:hypothetical protein